MSIQTASILVDGTIGVTGGTATPVDWLSGDQNQANVAIGGTSLLDRILGVITRKSPKPSATSPDGYTQARRRFLLKFPKTTASGKLTYSTWVVESARSVETTAAEFTTQKGIVCQIISDTDFDQYWDDGSLA